MDFAVIFNPHAEGETFQLEKNEDGSWNPLAQVFEIKREEESGRDCLRCSYSPKRRYLCFVRFRYFDDFGYLYSDAEERLLEKAREYVEKSKIDPSVYTCKLISAVAAGYDPATGCRTYRKFLTSTWEIV